MIVVLMTKTMQIIISIKVSPISRVNINYKENGGRKAFLANPRPQLAYPNVENTIIVQITKRMEIIMGIQVYHISRMNFDYKGNGKNKSFFGKCKPSISCIPMWRISL